MWLVDTNVLIAYFNEEDSVVGLFRKRLEGDELRISMIVAAEFLVRAEGDERRLFWELVERFPIIYLNEEILLKSIEVRKALLRKKKRVVMLDCFIAAIAMVNDWTLVTRNARDFKSIKGLKLKVV